MDERVERDVLKRTEVKCEEAKRMRTNYINLSKRHAESSKQYEDAIDKAEAVDMSPCTALKDLRVSHALSQLESV